MAVTLKDITLGSDGHLAPAVYWLLSAKDVAKISNGCGPGNWKLDLVPDKILGVDLTNACDKHDVCYYYGVTEEDKRLSDRLLLYNCLYDVDRYCEANRIIVRLQRVACREAVFSYYKAVSDLGHSAFYGKEKEIQNEKIIGTDGIVSGSIDRC